MNLLIFMMLCEVKPDAKSHESAGKNELRIDRFTKPTLMVAPVMMQLRCPLAKTGQKVAINGVTNMSAVCFCAASRDA